jgi:hypothetical protein
MRILRLAVAAAALPTAGLWTSADEPPAPDRPIEEVVDHFLDARLRDDGEMLHEYQERWAASR